MKIAPRRFGDGVHFPDQQLVMMSPGSVGSFFPHICVRGMAFALLLAVGREAPAASTAVQMTAGNVAELRQRGPDAWGGIGDWVLSNGTIRAVISNIDHESDLSAKGGVLVDLGIAGRADDQWVSAQDLLGGSRKSPVEFDTIVPAVGDGSASITASGWSDGIFAEVRYSVRDDTPQRLFVSKRIRRIDDDAKEFGVYTPITFNYQSMETFVLSSTHPERSNGFRQEEFSTRGPTAFGAAARIADTIVLLGPGDSLVPIAYGWRLASARRIAPDGEVTELPRFALVDWGAAAFLVATEDFLLGSSSSLGLLQLLQVARMQLDAGDELLIEEEILVGERGDVAGITDQLHPDAPRVTGVAAGEGAVLHVDRRDGAPFTFARPAADGAFGFRAPPGSYLLHLVAPGGLEVTRELEVVAGGTDLGVLDAGTPARVRLPRGEPLRLVFKGTNGTPDPDFEDSLTGFSVRDDDGVFTRPAVSAIFLAGIESDRSSVAIRPGSYRVHATRGIEYSLEKADLTVGPGETVDLQIAIPERVVQTPGFIAADLHVHSGPSMDNSFSTVERVRTFVAEHGEVMVAAEHETIFDFGPLIAEMGVGDRMVSITGHEMTSEVPHARVPHTIGHANFFPIAARPGEFRNGVPANEGRRMREVLAHIRQHHPDAVAQLNHPRHSLKLSGTIDDDYREHIHNHAYFDHMGPAVHPYDPSQPIGSHPNDTLIEADPVTGVRDLDFDAMEIMNGAHEYAPEHVEATQRDWVSLLRQGIRLTGTANSDSHDKRQQVALPRNMVAVADDRIAAFDVREFSDAIRRGRLYGTSGPLLEVALSGTPLGGTHSGAKARLEVKVMTADWIDAGTLRVFVNGEVAREAKVPEDGRFAEDLEFAQDAFVRVEVEGAAGEDYATVYPGFVPYAFTNPIWVDADGDGAWSPPGL